MKKNKGDKRDIRGIPTGRTISKKRAVAATKSVKGSGKGKHRLVVGGLPPEMLQIQREGCSYRRELEAAVTDVHGEISITHAHLIDTASAATIQAGVCRWLLRHRLDKMSPAEIRGCQDDIGKAKNRRDKAVQQLKLDTPPKNPWEIEGTAAEASE